MAKRTLYTNVVLMRSREDQTYYKVVCSEGMPGIMDADTKARELAGESPGWIFCAAKMRPSIVAEEIRQVIFKSADDNAPIDEEEVVEEDDEDSVPVVKPVEKEKHPKAKKSISKPDSEPTIVAQVDAAVVEEKKSSDSDSQFLLPFDEEVTDELIDSSEVTSDSDNTENSDDSKSDTFGDIFGEN